MANPKHTESISEDTVLHIAKLANVTLPEEELQLFTKQLGDTLSYITVLNEVNTDGIEPTAAVTGLHTVIQADEPHISLPKPEVFKNAKNKQDHFFKVKAVFE